MWFKVLCNLFNVILTESPNYVDANLACPSPPQPPPATNLSTTTTGPVCSGDSIRYSCNGSGVNGFVVSLTRKTHLI